MSQTSYWWCHWNDAFKLQFATLHATKAQYKHEETTSRSRQPRALTSVHFVPAGQLKNLSQVQAAAAAKPTYYVHVLPKIREVLFANFIIWLIKTTNPLLIA